MLPGQQPPAGLPEDQGAGGGLQEEAGRPHHHLYHMNQWRESATSDFLGAYQ